MDQAARTALKQPQPPPPLPLLVVARGRLQQPATTAPRRRRLYLLGGLAFGAIAALAAYFLSTRSPQEPPPRLPQGNVTAPNVPGSVLGLGKLLPRTRLLTIATPFGAGDARIAELHVEEGKRVEAGTILAVLDSAPGLRAALGAAQATLAAREAALAQTILMVTTGRDEARAALARAEAAVVNTGRDLERAESLIARGAATEQTRDQRRLAYEQAVHDVSRARAALARYDAPDLDRQADIVVSQRNLVAARAELERATADLDKALVRAPATGTVLTINARPGERPGSSGLMTFGSLDDMVAEVEVYETEIGALAAGDRVTLTAVALPHPLEGRIARVGLEVLRQTLTDASPAANTDTRVLRVTIDLDPPSAEVASRFANLQVTARFTPKARP